jgi:hypothetical protein
MNAVIALAIAAALAFPSSHAEAAGKKIAVL